MKIRVIIKETQVTEFTYEVEQATNLDEAKKVALQQHRTHFSTCPCYLYRMVPQPTNLEIGGCEMVSYD